MNDGSTRITGSTNVRGVALVMRQTIGTPDYELSWEGNGLSGCLSLSGDAEASELWTKAIGTLRANPHEEPFVEPEPEAEMAF